ncbi:hypothetical protein [Anaerobiospirillum sp. NML120449]|uniref:hypothetical protein n=1 Tax=Anaerobiospirillum sp. NML120449 TaxID=2932817 RepID=UPI001FF1C79A|nr:hypothetical protein [Anaerobiospirillum sp. NML120449]MCK0526496.1 hypothetical protein [Anaerobiospirillum sp. NML120449]
MQEYSKNKRGKAMSSSYFTPSQADLVSPAPAFYSQEVSTEYHVQSYEMSLSINFETS